MTQPRHMLSFDVEEFFQVEAARDDVNSSDWEQWPSRVGVGLDRILTLLAGRGIRATFFILGWVARRQESWVRRIAQAGHEIASHGMTHTMITRLSPESFRQELLDSKTILEDLSDRPVRGFRAPTFSILRETAWALDILAETGFEYDSSVFPIRHDRYGVPDAPRWAHRAIGPTGGRIVEIPPTTFQLPGLRLPAGGGGYLRLFPLGLISAGLRQAQKANQPGMVYLHPWEFDPQQPELPISRLSRWRHGVNIGRTEKKLGRLLDQFDFGPIGDGLATMDIESLPEFRYA